MNKRKLIAPIIITILLVAYFAFFVFGIMLVQDISLSAKIMFCAVPLLLAGVGIAMFCERFKEIKDGVEDDLSEY